MSIKLENGTYKFYQICDMMGVSGPTARKWIDDNTDIQRGKRKVDYTRKETAKILVEYGLIEKEE